MLATLTEIARRAGTQIQELQPRSVQTIHKGGLDFATAADLASQQFILGELSQKYPTIPVVAEEQKSPHISASTFFTVDPLDGTLIYKAGYDEWGVMIGYVENGQPATGVINVPARNILIAAERGSGCTVNGRTIRLTSHTALKETLIGGEVGWWIADEVLLNTVMKLKNVTRGIRAIMSFAGSVVDVVQGRIGAYVNPTTNVWEAVAGSIIVTEAGGVVTTLDGQPPQWKSIQQSFVAASSQSLLDEILTALGKKHPRTFLHGDEE